MHHRTLLLSVVCSLAAAFSAPAQLAPRTPAAPAPQPAPAPKVIKEEDAAKALAQLAGISKTLDEQKYGYNAKIIRELRDAGVSGEKAFGLWLDCMKDVEYDQKGKSATEFSDWKRRQTKDPNRDRDTELQMQVQWLSIVLMEANARTVAAKAEAIAAATLFLENGVARILKNDGRMGGAARENVLNSSFARHYKLDTTMKPKEGAAYVPGNIGEIYERMILPFYRETKQASSLMQAWAKRIEQQTAIANSFNFVEAKTKFTVEELPELRWGQAQELFKLGQEEPATQTMMSLIKANLGHRHAQQWIDELTRLLKREDQPASPGAVPDAPADPPADAFTPDAPVPAAPEPDAPLVPVPAPDDGSEKPKPVGSKPNGPKPALPSGGRVPL